MDEQEFEEILTYLSKNKYPESIKSKDSRSNWRKKCRPFLCCKDELYYNHKKYGALLAVKGVKDKNRVIEKCHIQADGKHHGINRTLKKISTNYYWKTIAKDVHNYVKMVCQSCIDQAIQQTNAAKNSNTSQEESEGGIRVKSTHKIVDKAIEQIGLDVIGNILEPSVPSPQEPGCTMFKCEGAVPQQSMSQSLVLRDHIMAQCGLDVVGPLSETHKGKRFIVVLTDCVTKWVEATAISEFTTESVGSFLVEAICRHGSIEEIMTKHNPDFCARLSEKLCSMIGIAIRMSTILPSQPNGYIEHYWYNSVLCGALMKYSNQNQYYWDTSLNQVILAYRTFHQKGLSGSPFQLLYDRPLRLPVMCISQPSGDAYSDEQEALTAHINNYLKALSCSTQQQQQPGTQHQDRLTPPYAPSGNIDSPSPSSTPINTSSQHQSSHVLGSFAQTVVTNNHINSTLPITTFGSNLQPASHNNVSVHAIPTTSITPQTIPANLNAHAMSTNTVTPQTIQSNSSHNLTTNSHIITTPSVTPVASQVITPHISVTQPTTVQTNSNITTNTSSDSHAGHMVMIQTDMKTYGDSIYLICSQ